MSHFDISDAHRNRCALIGTFTMLTALAAACGGDDPSAPNPTGPPPGTGGSSSVGEGGSATSAGGGDTTTTTSSAGGMGTGGDATGGAGGMEMTFCEPGVTASCYDGAPGTEGVGQCVAGTQTCLPDGSAFGACEAQVLPQAEDCNATGDEDCDGIACSETVWTSLFSGNDFVRFDGHAVDAGGNVYVALTHYGSLTVGTSTFPDVGNTQAALVKLDANGNVLWANSYGSSGSEQMVDVVLRNGNPVVVGTANSTINFGTTASTELDPINTGSFVAELDPAGNHVWSRMLAAAPLIGTVSAIGNRIARDVAVDVNGRVYVVGFLTGHFGGCVVCPSFTGNAGFVRAFDGQGTAVTTEYYDGSANQYVDRVVGNPTGAGVIIGGRTSATTSLGNGFTLTPEGGQDAFVARLAANGDPAWAQMLGVASSSFQQIHGLDWVGNRVAVVGVCAGSYEVASFLQATAADTAGMLFELSDNGTLTWADIVGTSDDSQLNDVAIDGQGHIVATGYANGQGDVDGLTYDGGGSTEGLVLKTDASGSALWLRELPSSDTHRPTDIDLGPGDQIWVGATFEGTVDFGTGPQASNLDDAVVWTVQP